MSSHPDQEQTLALLHEAHEALKDIYAWYGRSRIAPYSHEHGVWQKARSTIARADDFFHELHHHGPKDPSI